MPIGSIEGTVFRDLSSDPVFFPIYRQGCFAEPQLLFKMDRITPDRLVVTIKCDNIYSKCSA